MTDNNESLDIGKLGHELHRAETEICLGRRAIVDLQVCEPVDQEALVAERKRVLEARLARNAIRPQLERTKVASAFWQYKW